MDRIKIKEKAKEMMKENLKTFWIGYGVILAIAFLCSLAIELLLENGSMIYNTLTILASLFTMTLEVGFYDYILKIVRGKEPERQDIFKYIGNILPIITISLLVMIFCFLWSILFIIPGIIAALSYTMVYYIYVDEPNLLPMDYLEKSKAMMNGYKWDYFVFNLSFLGWIFVSILTLGIGLIWTIPYITIAETLYYDELKNKKEKE